MSARTRDGHRADDRGFTLMELMVAVGLMGVVMAIVTGSIVMMYRSTQHSEAVSRTSQEINTAFTWLDGHLRYAHYIGDPVSHGSGWQVSFSAPEVTTGQARCYQLRLDASAGALRWRTAPAGAWSTLATDVINGASDAPAGVPANPFTVLRPGDIKADGSGTARRSELMLSITVRQGAGDRAVLSESSAAYVALNSAGSGAGAAAACQGVT